MSNVEFNVMLKYSVSTGPSPGELTARSKIAMSTLMTETWYSFL